MVASRTTAFAPGVTARELFDAEHAGIAVAMPLPVPEAAAAAAADAPADEVDGVAPDAAALPAPSVQPESSALRLVSERRRGRWADDGGVVVEMTLDDVTLHRGSEPPRRFVELRLAAPDWETLPARTAALHALFAARAN